jgi:hypothetical protein
LLANLYHHRGLGRRPPSQSAEFAVTAEQAASARDASIVSAHTAGQIISVVTVLAADGAQLHNPGGYSVSLNQATR